MWHDLVIYTPMYVTAFWAFVLLFTPIKKNRAKYFLGLFMVAAFFLYFSHTLFFKQQFIVYLILDPVYMFTSLSVYPLYYWYIKLLTEETELKIKNLRLLFPGFFLATITLVIYLAMPRIERIQYLQNFLLERNNLNELSLLSKIQALVFLLGRVVFSVQVVFFLIFGRKLVIRYNNHISNFYSNLEDKTILWVNYLLYSFVATSTMSIVFNIIGRSVFIEYPAWLLLPSFIFSVLLFFIGFLGYMQNHSVMEFQEDEKQEPAIQQNSWNFEQLSSEVLQLFESGKIYLEPNLKITHVCAKLNSNRTYISRLINNEFNATFNEFVNRYRVEEAKKILQNDSSLKFSLNHISESAGFGSASSFNRIFKDLVGLTPGQYREEIIRKGKT